MNETIVTVKDKLEQINVDTIKAGAEIHAGDGGYELSTHEKQQEFARKRNYPIPGLQENFKSTRSSSEKFFPNK